MKIFGMTSYKAYGDSKITKNAFLWHQNRGERVFYSGCLDTMNTSCIDYEKFKTILQFVEEEASKPLEDHNYEIRIWHKGYRKAMIITSTNDTDSRSKA